MDQAVLVPSPATDRLCAVAREAGVYLVVGIDEREPHGGTIYNTLLYIGPDGIVENMFASDLAFLQDFYEQINAEGHTLASVTCPNCAEDFEIDLGGSRLGES